MRQARSTWTILLFALVVAFFVYFSLRSFSQVELSSTQRAMQKKLEKENSALTNLQFNLSDPEQAPPGLKDVVMQGFEIILHTPYYLPEFVGGELSCTNCHIAGGNTLGSKGGGISLAGVAAAYPTYNERSHTVIDLQRRINECFKRSMNGKPLPFDSEEMLALVTYMTWISKGFPIYEEPPWLGLKPCVKQNLNPERGKDLYVTNCADCHGTNGEGGNRHEGDVGRTIPPLWGPHSFNDGAGMHRQEILASFIFNNMPYLEPILTEDEACDIAAFIRQQPRPHYEIKRQ